MPSSRFKRYTEEYGISEIDAKTLVQTKIISDFFENALKRYDNPKSVAVFILGEFMRKSKSGRDRYKQHQLHLRVCSLLKMYTEKVSGERR